MLSGAMLSGAMLGGQGGVMVGKGAVSVATAPFRDSEAEKEAKRQQALNAAQAQ